MEFDGNKILEDLKAKLKSLEDKINGKTEKIQTKKEEIANEQQEITRIEGTKKGDNPKFDSFNEMVESDLKNRNQNINKKEKEIKQEEENIEKLKEEKKTSIQNARDEVKKDSSKKLVLINKLNEKVTSLKHEARTLKLAKNATTDKQVYKINDEQHKAKMLEIQNIYREKNNLYNKVQENNKILDEIDKLEENLIEKEDITKTGDTKTGDGKTGDGKTGDGKTDDGKTGDGKTDDGKTGDGKTGDGKTGDGKTGDGKTGDGKTGDGKTGDGKTGDGKTGDGKTGDGKTGDGKTDDGKTGDGKTDDGKTGDGKTDDGKTGDGKTGDGKTGDGKTGDGKTDDGKTGDGKTDDGKTDDGKTGDGKTGDGKTGDGKTEPLKVEPGIKYDDLLNKLAEVDGVTPKEKLEELSNQAKRLGLSLEATLEDVAQEKGLIPLQIKDITIDKEAYTITYGNGNYPKMYFIGEKNDATLVKFDRKSEAKFKEFILEEFPESEKVINKLDIGIINVLYANNRLDLCKAYIESIENKEANENLPKIKYDLSDAKGLSRTETVLRRNARNNKNIAEIEGNSKNPLKRTYDFVRERVANLATRAYRRLHPHQWEDDVRQLKEDMRLMLPEGQKEYVEKGNKILEEVLQENEYSSISKEDLNKPKSVKFSPEVQAKIDEAKKKQEEVGKLSWRESMKVAVDNRKIYSDMKKEEKASKTVETPAKTDSGKEPSDD